MLPLNQRPARLALLTALLAGVGAQAQAADPFLSSTSSITNLNFQLIDLNPNDGIAPSFSILRDGSIYTYGIDPVSENYTEGVSTPVALIGTRTGSPFSTLTQPVPGGTLSTTPNSVVLKQSVSAQDLSTQAINNTYTYSNGPQLVTVTETGTTVGGGNESTFSLSNDAFGGYYYNTDGSLVNGFSGRLSANTALIITGQATVNIHADRSLLDTQSSAADPGALSTSAGMTRGSISLSLSGGSSPNQWGSQTGTYSNNVGLDVEADLAPGLTTLYLADGSSDTTDAVVDKTVTKSFSLVGFNNDTTDADMSLYLSLLSSSFHVVKVGQSTQVITDDPNWVPPTPIPTDPGAPNIPEPSTYALMGLGLVGIALVSRRRAQQV